MGARDVNAERIGISQIDLYGFQLSDDDLRQQKYLVSITNCSFFFVSSSEVKKIFKKDIKSFLKISS